MVWDTKYNTCNRAQNVVQKVKCKVLQHQGSVVIEKLSMKPKKTKKSKKRPIGKLAMRQKNKSKKAKQRRLPAKPIPQQGEPLSTEFLCLSKAQVRLLRIANLSVIFLLSLFLFVIVTSETVNWVVWPFHVFVKSQNLIWPEYLLKTVFLKYWNFCSGFVVYKF